MKKNDLFPGLSVRSNNCLRYVGINTDEKLKALVLLPPREMKKLRNFGDVCCREVLRYARLRNWPIYNNECHERSYDKKFGYICNLISLMGMAISDLYENEHYVYDFVKQAMKDNVLYGDIPKPIKDHVLDCICAIESKYEDKKVMSKIFNI